MAFDFKIGKVYTFDTNAPAILGATVSNAKLLGIMDYNTALTYENIDLKYRSVYPALDPTTPDNPEMSVYYWFATESGEKIIIADIWVAESTVVVIQNINFQIIFTQASISDIDIVRQALNAYGYTNFEIKQV